jgi:hypothetical protein
MAQAHGVVKASLPDPDAALTERAGLLRVADADAGLLGVHPLEELLGNAPAELTGSAPAQLHARSPPGHARGQAANRSRSAATSVQVSP